MAASKSESVEIEVAGRVVQVSSPGKVFFPDARVSAPFSWNELPDIELGAFTVKTVPQRYQEKGDPGAGIDSQAFSLEPLLELVKRHEAAGQGDAPWPPHDAKQEGEPKRVAPSRKKKDPEAS